MVYWMHSATLEWVEVDFVFGIPLYTVLQPYANPFLTVYQDMGDLIVCYREVGVSGVISVRPLKVCRVSNGRS